MLFAYFFYKSVWAFLILSCFVPLFLRAVKVRLTEQVRWKLTLEFREYIKAISTNLSAGSSVENAFRRAYKDIFSLYGNKSDMVNEGLLIAKCLDNNMVLEDILKQFARRSGIEEIMDFADIFEAAKRSGGNLKEIIEDCAASINDKVELKRELKVLISEKQFEHRIMCVVPFGIIIYVSVSNQGYFDALYNNMTGIIVMTVCLLAYMGAFIWGEKILGAIR